MERTVIARDERIAVVCPEPSGNVHLHAFDEVTRSLVDGLAAMGVDVVAATRLDPTRRSVLFASHLLSDDDLAGLPDGTILYNLEQIDDGSMLPPRRLPAFERFGVWDYSRRNLAAWSSAGVEAALVPIGHADSLRTLDRTGPRDIDVLFYGSINDRRRHVLEAMQRAGLRVEAAFGVYGAERDALIERARAVVNIQYYEARILETVRLSHLFANGVPVISEAAPTIDRPDGLADAAWFVPYDRLVRAAVDLLADEAALAALGERGQRRMEALGWPAQLAVVVASEPKPAPCLALRCVPGAPEAGGGAARDLVGRVTTALLRDAGIDRSTLGPPPDLSIPAVAAMAETTAAELPDALARDGATVHDGGLGFVLPFWTAVAAEAGVALDVTIDVPSPVAVALAARAAGRDHTSEVLRWVSAVAFAEAETRGSARTVDVAPAEAIRQEVRSPALERAVALAAAVAVEDADRIDELVASYLDAMSWYLPLLVNRRA